MHHPSARAASRDPWRAARDGRWLMRPATAAMTTLTPRATAPWPGGGSAFLGDEPVGGVDAAEQVRDDVEPRAPLVVRVRHVPRQSPCRRAWLRDVLHDGRCPQVFWPRLSPPGPARRMGRSRIAMFPPPTDGPPGVSPGASRPGSLPSPSRYARSAPWRRADRPPW